MIGGHGRSLDRSVEPSHSIENHGFDSGKILYRYEDELDTQVTIEVSFSIAGEDRKKFLKAFVDLTDEFRI